MTTGTHVYTRKQGRKEVGGEGKGVRAKVSRVFKAAPYHAYEFNNN